ncbi:MAG TPA: hypothetical protein VMD27_07180 [Candidatus Aquilonibacter sp.]|nr:hypothetical protein [Candidatus Aquilonibacter sp.]
MTIPFVFDDFQRFPVVFAPARTALALEKPVLRLKKSHLAPLRTVPAPVQVMLAP